MNAHGIRNRFPLAKIFPRIAELRLSPKKQGVAKPIVLQHLEFSVYNKGRYLGKGKKPFKERFFFPSSTCPAIALCDGGTPPLFPLSRRSPKGEDGKPFIGIYLFAMQKDKCLWFCWEGFMMGPVLLTAGLVYYGVWLFFILIRQFFELKN